jgi:hypothetical protein
MTTQKQIRAAFWAAHPEHEAAARARRTRSKPQNHHNATTRCAFVDFVDALNRSGQISDALANRATL